MNFLYLSLFLVELLYLFFNLILCFSLLCISFIVFVYMLFISGFYSIFITKSARFCQWLFLCLMRLLFLSVYMVDYIAVFILLLYFSLEGGGTAMLFWER